MYSFTIQNLQNKLCTPDRIHENFCAVTELVDEITMQQLSYLFRQSQIIKIIFDKNIKKNVRKIPVANYASS